MKDWTKDPTDSDCREFMHNETEWPGKKPKAPKTLKGCLADLIKDSTSWLRKCPDVWFQRHEKALIVEARGAAESGDEIIELYDEAIAAVQWVAGCARVAEEKLRQSKALAIKSQRKMKAKRQSG
jgi:hypothetical protein